MTNEQILKRAYAKAIQNGWNGGSYYKWRSPMDWLFSHNFAKAFWKGDKTRWDIHLQRMVVWPEPLKYLEKFLGEEKGK